MIELEHRYASTLSWQKLTISADQRAALMQQTPAIVWFTGLSGAGKSTIADLVEQRLFALRHHTMLLDGDNLRHGLSRDLGFTDADRVENIRRTAEAAKLMSMAGLIVICSLISPFRAERQMACELTAPVTFFEIFVDTPLEECIRRDPKGLYAKSRAGRLRNLTGIDSPYEPPEQPDLRLATLQADAEALADRVLALLRQHGVVRSEALPRFGAAARAVS
ncbi:MAG: adenylyl-sulfate kinase [Alphaproteobacteria bacterium]|nr:adenylyl-sulfate kinase [Alphaproteobacteria bacterium]